MKRTLKKMNKKKLCKIQKIKKLICNISKFSDDDADIKKILKKIRFKLMAKRISTKYIEFVLIK